MPAQRDQRPHIVWIVLDTHRLDRIGAYGCPRRPTPNLDDFTHSATLFERAIAPGQWTIPSHASMFTGEFPSTHQVTQSGDMLDPAFRTAADWLRQSGYQTTGFCNNPLVGVIENAFTRGFETFYNYGGAAPTTPVHALHQPVRLLSQIGERYTRLLQRISYPIQNAVARSEAAFRFSLNPLLVPIWTRIANFKGKTRLSIDDTDHFIRSNLTPNQARRHFVFLNVMETHLPFAAPEVFTRRFAPIVKEERAAADFLRVYNTLAMRWLMPMEEPFSPLEAETLSQMYDAEVAYQDHLLGRLLETLDQPYHRDHTAVIILSDHGEMLGEHRQMGHGFGVHEELIHVPLMIRLPGQEKAQRVPHVVSTAQIFHTLLNLGQAAAGSEEVAALAQRLDLCNLVSATQPASLVVSEAFPPQNMVNIIAAKAPALIPEFHSQSVIRAAYNQYGEKLVQTEGVEAALYRLAEKAEEIHRWGQGTEERHPLEAGLDLFLEAAIERQPQNWTRRQVSLDDKLLQQRLRSLGYLE